VVQIDGDGIRSKPSEPFEQARSHRRAEHRRKGLRERVGERPQARSRARRQDERPQPAAALSSSGISNQTQVPSVPLIPQSLL
jgi:hypothetical protein